MRLRQELYTNFVSENTGFITRLDCSTDRRRWIRDPGTPGIDGLTEDRSRAPTRTTSPMESAGVADGESSLTAYSVYS